MPDTSSTGIIPASIPAIPGVAFGIVPVEEETSTVLAWPAYFTQTQKASLEIGGNLYVYHDQGHGVDRYLVVYVQNGTANPGAPSITDQALPLGGRSGQDLAQGYFQRMISMSVSPSANDPSRNSGIHWVGNSPTNVNVAVTESKQIVSSVSSTIEVGGSSDGPSVSGSTTTESQTWSGESFTLTEWGIDDLSDASSNKAEWRYYQNQPWDGRNDPNAFGDWWEQAYNMGGGWDDVRHPTNLSKLPLAYTNVVAWHFDSGMKAADGTLMVTFTGQVSQFLVGVNMVQLNDNGHHQIWPAGNTLSWSRTVDLAAVARLT